MADRIKGITIEIDGDATKLQSALKNVNTEIRTSQSQLKDLDKLLKLDPGNTELLKQKFNTLGNEIDETKRKLETLKTAEEQMKNAGQTDTAEWDALQREISETESNLKNLEQEYKNFGTVAAQQVAAVGEKMKDLGSKFENAGSKLTTHVTLPLAAAGAAGVASFADVDKTMQLANKTMGNTAEEADELNTAMKNAAANSTYGMKDAATATLNFARAGLDAEQSSAALAPAMNLAAGEGGNLDTVSAGLVATINGFHGSFSDAGHYADVFASACNNSALDVDSLSNAMSVAAPIFSSAGYSVNDAALYMGVMANNGIEADKAANSLKTGLARLVSPAKEGAAMMDKLGISVTNSDGTMKDSVTIQKELHNAFSKLSESEQLAAASAIFGKNQMAPWLALINTAPTDVDKLNTSLTNCSGTTEEMANTMMGGFGGSIEKLKSSIDVLVYSLGQALAPTIQKVVNFIQGLVDKFNSLSPAQQELIVKIGLIVAAVGPLLIVIGKLTSAVGTILTWAPKIVSGISTIGGGLKTLWGVLSANPIAAVIAIVAALVAGFIYLWNNCEGFREFWIGLWNKLKEIVSTVVEAIKKAITTAWNAIKTTTTTIFNAVKTAATTAWNGIKTAVTTVVNAIKSVVTSVWNAIKSAVTTTVNAIKTAVTTAWNAIKSAVSTVLNAIKSAVTTAWNAIKSAVSTAMNAIKSTVTSVWNGIKSAVSTAINGVKSAISTGMNAAKSTVTSVLNGIKSAFTSAWNGAKSIVSGAISAIKNLMNFHWELPKLKLPHFSISGSFSLNPPSIPHISVQWYKKAMNDGMILNSPTIFGASGGNLLGGGEAGPEAVVGTSSLRSMIQEAVASQTAALAAAVGGDVNVYIGDERLDAIIQKSNKRVNLRSGGR